MATKQPSGLSYVSADAPAEDIPMPEDTSTVITGKAPAQKGAYGLPMGGVPTGVDEGLLESMQNLIIEREAQKKGFMENLKDATAWWSGGMAGPSEALGRRAKERDVQDETIFGMKKNLAEYRVAQENAKSMDKALFGVPAAAPTQAQPGMQTQPGAVAAPNAASPGAPVAQPTGLLGLVKDGGLRDSIAFQAKGGDRAGALKSIQNYLAKNAEDPQLVKEIRAGVANGWIKPDLIPAVYFTKMVGSGAMVPHNINTPGGTMQGTPFSAAMGINSGAAPSAMPTPAPAMPAPAMPAPAMPAPAMPAPAIAPKPAMPAPAMPAPAMPAPAMPAPAMPASAPVSATPEIQPLVSPVLKTGFTPGSEQDLAAKLEAAKTKISTQAEQQKPIEKGAGESAVQLLNSASSAKNNITEYDMAEGILKKYPKAFGIGQDGSATAAVIQLVKPGTTIPILGTVKSEGIEEAVAQKSLPKKAIEARNMFNAIATRQGVEYAKNNLTGEGRGTLSNADMKMAQVAKGLSTDSPAASNLIFTVLNRENEMMILQRSEDWKKYQANARAQGFQPDFNRFKETPEYTKAMDDKDARVRKRFPEFFKNEAAESSGKKTAKDFFR